ncbi:LysO family transporter [Porphyromonas pogonae]|uniref:LysO family transporter n=1 Tax=Porphyromonas pogonae TaxID=867595 RepID=UPI002E76F333|nr:LysO family transporter [Porphyromonas pogonae]
MLIIICFLILGIGIGYLFRHNNLKYVSNIISVLTWLLLFFIGYEFGCDRSILANLTKIGFDALLITLFAVLFSCLAAKWTLGYFQKFYKRTGHEK